MSALTRLVPLLIATSTLVLVLLLLATTNVNGFNIFFLILLRYNVIVRFSFGASALIWIYLVSYHTKKNSSISQSMMLATLPGVLVHLCMVIFSATVPHDVYLTMTRFALFVGCIITSASIVKLHKKAYDKMYMRMKRSDSMLKEVKHKLNALNSHSNDSKNQQTELEQARAMIASKDELLVRNEK